MRGQDLADRTTIVTGAGGGIGRKMVEGILSAGGRVLAVDVNEAALKSLGSRRRLSKLAVDLTDHAAPAQILEAAKAAFGSFNALVNNAGLGRSIYTANILNGAPAAWRVPPWAWDKMFRINVLSAIHLTNTLLPHLLHRESSSLVFVTTSLNSMINSGTGPYGPSKAALEAFAAVLSEELAGEPVSVNVLIPGGIVDTPMIPDQPTVERRDYLDPGIMVAPLNYLLSKEGREVSGRRIRANLWQESVEPVEAMRLASAPIAWSSNAAGQRREPGKPGGPFELIKK